jgi:hypothetical protein
VLAVPEAQVPPLLLDVLPLLLDALTAPVPLLLLLEVAVPPVLPPPVEVKPTLLLHAAKPRESAPAATRVDVRWFMVSFRGRHSAPRSPDGHGGGGRSRKRQEGFGAPGTAGSA